MRKRETDELTFEQPEETVFIAGVKPDGAAVIRNQAGHFYANESGTAGMLYPVFRLFEGRDFLLPPLLKGRGTALVHTVEGFCKDILKTVKNKKNPLATPYGMWPSPL